MVAATSTSTSTSGTGLLSLNVHEALNFDGTPICLHPELFSSGALAATTGTGTASAADGGGGGGGSMGTTVVAGNHHPQPQQHRLLMINPTMSSDDGGGGTVLTSNTTATTTATTATTAAAAAAAATATAATGGIQVGDLIEIRVWDPCGPTAVTSQHHAHTPRKGTGAGATGTIHSTTGGNNRSSILRRPANGTSSLSTGSNASAASGSPDNLPLPPPPALETSSPSPSQSSSIADQTLPLPTVTSLSSLQQGLPQPQLQPPKSTSNTVAVKSATTASATVASAFIAKPPIQRRAVTTTGVPETGTTTKAKTKQSLGVSSQRLIGSGSRHVRDISDMTIETEYENNNNKLTNIHNSSDENRNPPKTTTSEQSIVSAPVVFQRSHPSSSEDLAHTSVVWNHQQYVSPHNHYHRTHQLRVSFCMLVTEKTLTSLKGSARTQISILRPVADLYKLSSYDMVSVHILTRDNDNNSNNNESTIARHNVGVDFLLVTIKDQFISRGDMHYFQNSMIGHWIYQGQRLYESTRGFQANAREIRRSAEHVLSGVVTSKTVITFRSRSSRIIWLVQMSSEMWDYAPTDHNSNNNESVCEIYFDKWITFIHKLFTKWKELEATHALTVVFFSRTFISSPNESHVDTTADSTTQRHPPVPPTSPPQLQRDVYGRYYEDHFRVVLENETTTDWHSLVVRIKEAFVRYPFEVGWSLQPNLGCIRKPSTASHGNVLEAINVTLNLLQFHYLDRDLQRTGNSIVVVSAGNGVFEVNRNLNEITYQRMMDNGIGSDMLSLGLPALHIAPFFLYSNPPTEALFDKSQEQYYDVPHWMHLSFVSYESDEAVFVDHLYDPKESQLKEDAQNTQQAGIEVASNGFLLSTSYRKSPEVLSNSLQPQQPKIKIPHGRSSGRQLIDGRDFRDIVEACRPRHVGKIPSALLALLQVSSKGATSLLEDEFNPLSDDNIEEWGTLKFDSLQRSTMGIRPTVTDFVGSLSSGQLSISPQLNTATGAGALPEQNVLSATSSFESQINITYRSFSDDNTHAGTSARPRPVTQLQRSASLTLETDDLVSTPKDLAKSFASGVSSDEDETDDNEENSQLANLLRTMMRNHDSTLMHMVSPKLGPKIEPMQSALTQNIENPVAVGQSTLQNGVGAALNQYRITTSRNFKLASERGNTMLSRTTSLFEPSGATGQASLRRIADAESHRLSPLLLPPAVNTMTQPVDGAHHRLPPEIIPFERRLIKPQEYSTNLKSTDRVSASIAEPSIAPKRSDAMTKQNPLSLSRSPPKGRTYGSPPKESTIRLRSDGGLTSPTSKTWQRGTIAQTRTNTASRRKKMFNPFRQEDEDAVLAMKSHNRRRWSHVFPLGEVEFKRHAGPNWRSLTAPAILPLSIDYFPPQEEIDYHFTSGFHNVTLSEFEHKNFSSNKDLLIEMVRQRLTQDFQVVPEDCIDLRKYRMVPLEGTLNASTVLAAQMGGSETIRLFLSMGHILHTLTYYMSKDIVEVRRYTAKETQKNFTDNYQYLTICQETQSFKKCQQTFAKYTDQYNWNKVDNIICGADDREMREGMRFKRIMFGIVPDCFGSDLKAEDAYVVKFRRLLEYLEKLRDKAEASTPLAIKFVTSLEKENQMESQRLESLPGVERDSMVRFYVQLRKGKSDILEWMEVAVDATFDTSWTYRIMFNWLVASSGKVDSQVQLLQRRCTQYGLRLIPFPQITVSKNVYLNPFKAPAILVTKHRSIDRLTLDRQLVGMDYVYDGVFLTAVEPILECIEKDINMFQFRRERFKLTTAPAMGKQFVHRSGTLFVRVLCDLNDRFILVVLGNYRYLNMMNNKDATVIKTYAETYDALKTFASTL